MIEGLSGTISTRGVKIQVLGIHDSTWAISGAQTWRGAQAQTFRRYGPANFGFMPELGPALTDFNPDLVHLHGIWMYSSKVAADWAGTSGRPLVISPHGMLAPRALAYSPLRKRIVRELFQDRCFARAAGYHATAEAEAADIRSHLGEVPVVTIQNGVTDSAVSRPSWRDRACRVVAIGRLHPVKGYDRLLRAWAEVEPGAQGWSLEIAGPDVEGHGDALRRLAGELGLARTTIGPPRYGEERDALIADSRLFALPSLTENFALTVPEALVCGTPVLASTGAPWAALIENDCGWWVAPEPEPLAAALREAVTMPEERLAAMGTAGRTWALETFGWDGIADRMIEFYALLVQGEVQA